MTDPLTTIARAVCAEMFDSLDRASRASAQRIAAIEARRAADGLPPLTTPEEEPPTFNPVLAPAAAPGVPSRWRKKPVVIEAMRWDGTHEAAVQLANWVMAGGGTVGYGTDTSHDEYFDGAPVGHVLYTFTVDTLEGRMNVSPGDWVIRGVQGEHYPCKPDIFEATYDPAS